jgi:hypothetical protein
MTEERLPLAELLAKAVAVIVGLFADGASS